MDGCIKGLKDLDILRILHLVELTDIPQESLHCLIAEISCWKFKPSSKVLIFLKQLESSANKARFDSEETTLERSFIYKSKNKKGPRIDPCGTPESMGSQLEELPSITTL